MSNTPTPTSQLLDALERIASTLRSAVDCYAVAVNSARPGNEGRKACQKVNCYELY